MSLQVLCPTCGQIADIHRTPITTCPRCNAAFPEPMRASATAALERQAAPKPALLWFGQFMSLFTGGMFLLFMLMAPFDVGTYHINGEQMSGPEFLRSGGWLMGIMGGILLAIAIALWQERAWARPLMLLYWLSFALLGVIGSSEDWANAITTGIMALACCGIAAWYLYGKANVRRYFETREAKILET